MRKLLLIAAVLAVVPVMVSGAGAESVGDQAHGAGTIEWNHCPPDAEATFAFDASGGIEGENAAGTFEFACGPTLAQPGGTHSGVVRCLSVRGTEATIGGVVTASTMAAFPVGTEYSFTVVDGGPAGAGDLVSDLVNGSACRRDNPLHPLLAGDVVVADAVAEPPPPPPGATALALSPPTAVNPVGTTHTVTATATTATGDPAAGLRVELDVTGSVATSGTCTTDAAGRCTFTYTGPALPGADLITACVDGDRDGVVEPGEPCADATKIWILPTTTPGQATGGGWIVVGGERVSFGFNAQSKGGEAPKGNCNVVDEATRTQVKCLTVDTFAIAGTHATFFGDATVDGAPTRYRIDVDDLGAVDTFAIRTLSGYAAAGTLAGGNVQVRV